MAVSVMTMNAKKTLLLVLVLSVLFNGVFGVLQMNAQRTAWMFPELGPAVVQDSSYARAPGLELPGSLFGDLPGAYPIYNGNPLQTGNWTSARIPEISVLAIIIAAAFGIVPLVTVLVLGRRSYGASKTH